MGRLVEVRCADGRWWQDPEAGVELRLWSEASTPVRFALEVVGEGEVQWSAGKPVRTSSLDDSRGPGVMPAARRVLEHTEPSRALLRRVEQYLEQAEGLDEGLRRALLGIVVAGTLGG